MDPEKKCYVWRYSIDHDKKKTKIHRELVYILDSTFIYSF